MKKLFYCILLLSFYSVSAQSYVPEQNDKRIKVEPAIDINAYAFDLKDVKLLDGPFHHAMSMDSAYLMELKPDRLLYRFYKFAGLPVKDSVYGGWESEGLSGHTLGHYLSASSMMFASTGNSEFKKRVDYTVEELRKCQKARKTGYVGAIPDEDSIFGKVARGEIRSGGFDLNGGWSPWYTVHKVMAGLVDAYLYCDSKMALKVVEGMADWTYNTVFHLSDSLRLKMLNCEYGGMNEVLANIYAITGNKKYLDLSYKFYDEFVMGKLAQQIDPMPGKHSNTNVPKAIGSARQYELTGNNSDKTIASFFWETMVNHHSYVIGGNSNYEYCGRPDSLSERLSDATCETCNTYNMLRLTRHLFAINPSGRLMDFYERALYNHILASQNPENGMMTYFVPLRMGTRKEFSDSFNTFTCCVGSGIENHSKYAEQIYSHNEYGNLMVNLFIPSELNWKENKMILRQETKFPEENSTTLIYLGEGAMNGIIYVRKPYWAKNFRFFRNGKQNNDVKDYTGDNDADIIDGYIPLRTTFIKGDKLEIKFDMDIYTEAMPDNPNRIAFKYGPVVLAGQLGKKMPDPLYGTPVLLTDNKHVNDWIKPTGDPLVFELKGVGKPHDVQLAPFYKTYDQYYSVYWDYFSQAEWAGRQAEYEAAKKAAAELEARTIDHFRVGEMQPERDHKLTAGERSYVSDAMGKKGREARAGDFFGFEMKVDPGVKNTLLLTYIGDDRGRKFDILVDGVKVATEEWEGGKTGYFYDKEYKLPEELLKDKKVITVRIEANYRRTAGRVFDVRIIRVNK
ncbi:MAG: glycoside hydrolase family 127 protein [Chitinophagaceae bacterium]|nr:glycoside hydrolase family 127 protein [Chitinophagaceae bacterium]